MGKTVILSSDRRKNFFSRDFVTNWMTACEIVEKNAFLGAENSYNLFTVKHDNSATTVEEQMRLTVCSFIRFFE